MLAARLTTSLSATPGGAATRWPGDAKAAVVLTYDDGVGSGHLAVTDAKHRAFLTWLKAHRRDIWVSTLQQALDWAK